MHQDQSHHDMDFLADAIPIYIATQGFFGVIHRKNPKELVIFLRNISNKISSIAFGH